MVSSFRDEQSSLVPSAKLKKVALGVLERASPDERADDAVLIRRIKALCQQGFSGPLPADQALHELLNSVREGLKGPANLPKAGGRT